MNRLLYTFIAATALVVAGCQSAPPPVASPEPASPAPAGEAPRENVSVNASALNVRSEPSMSAEILTQVKRGERLPLIEDGESWMKIELPDGRTGWAASRFLLHEGEKPSSKRRKRGGCLPDSDFALATAPTPTFSDSDSHGSVVVEAHVGKDGKVKSTKLITNSTGDETLALLTRREIESATFVAPVRDCRQREFIYTYTRKF